MKEKYWRKMTWEQQEKLTTYKNVILTDPIPTKKQTALKILNMLDYTTKEGKETYSKAFDKFDEYSEKFENAMKKVDKAFDDVDNSLGGDKGTKTTKKKKDGFANSIHFELWDSSKK